MSPLCPGSVQALCSLSEYLAFHVAFGSKSQEKIHFHSHRFCTWITLIYEDISFFKSSRPLRVLVRICCMNKCSGSGTEAFSLQRNRVIQWGRTRTLVKGPNGATLGTKHVQRASTVPLRHGISSAPWRSQAGFKIISGQSDETRTPSIWRLVFISNWRLAWWRLVVQVRNGLPVGRDWVGGDNHWTPWHR